MSGENDGFEAFNMIWRRSNVPKDNFILWLLWHGKLLTRESERLHQLHCLHGDTECIFLRCSIGTLGHFFFVCPFSELIVLEMMKCLGLSTLPAQLELWEKKKIVIDLEQS